MSQEVARLYLGKDVLYQQISAMQIRILYKGSTHLWAIQRLYTIDEGFVFLTPHETNFTDVEMAQEIVRVILHVMAKSHFIKLRGRDCTTKTKVLNKIESTRKCVNTNMELNWYHKTQNSNNDGNKDKQGTQKDNQQKYNTCQIPGYDHN